MSEDFFAGGVPAEAIRADLGEARRKDHDWRDLHNLRACYFAGNDVVALAEEAFTSYLGKNALYGALAYPSLRRYEEEVVRILLRLFRAPPEASGSLTT